MRKKECDDATKILQKKIGFTFPVKYIFFSFAIFHKIVLLNHGRLILLESAPFPWPGSPR
jgi:hypothetical protein